MWDIDVPEAGEAVIPVNSFVGLRGAGHLVTVYDVVIGAAPASVGLGAASAAGRAAGGQHSAAIGFQTSNLSYEFGAVAW